MQCSDFRNCNEICKRTYCIISIPATSSFRNKQWLKIMRLECSDTSPVSRLHNLTNIQTSSRTANWAYISCRAWESSTVNNDLLQRLAKSLSRHRFMWLAWRQPEVCDTFRSDPFKQLIKADHGIDRVELWVLQNSVLLITQSLAPQSIHGKFLVSRNLLLILCRHGGRVQQGFTKSWLKDRDLESPIDLR